MPRFSDVSVSRLSTCDLELQVLFFEVIKHVDCIVLEGHRGEAAQEEAFKKGTSQVHWPHGKHNSIPSQAVDVAPCPIDWNNLKRFYWFAGIVMGTAEQLKAQGKMKRSIRFGGDWGRDFDITNEKGFLDLVHFEIIL